MEIIYHTYTTTEEQTFFNRMDRLMQVVHDYKGQGPETSRLATFTDLSELLKMLNPESVNAVNLFHRWLEVKKTPIEYVNRITLELSSKAWVYEDQIKQNYKPKTKRK